MSKKHVDHPDPESMQNGEFTSKGGFEIYKMLYVLNGRVSKLEAKQAIMWLITTGLVAGILAKLQGFW